jgi:hypothetical protein
MDQNSKDALVVWAGTILGAAGGWLGSGRLAAGYGLPLGTWGKLAGGLIGAVAGAALTKMIVTDQNVIPEIGEDEF